MQPLYLARIEDLGFGDLLKVDCAARWRCSGLARASPNGHGAREGAAPGLGDTPQRRPHALGLGPRRKRPSLG
jgi:hypothetical protein